MKKPSVWTLIASLIIILALGLSTVWSTFPPLFLSQVIFILVGLFLFLAVSRLDRQLIESMAIPAYFLCLFLLVLTYLVGTISRGSLRWIDLGFFRLQTSEFAKPLLLIAWAHLFSRPSPKFIDFLKNLVLIVLPAALILFQPDLGSALIVAITGFMVLLHSGRPLKYSLTLLLVALILSPLIFNFLHDYQRQRLISFINPYADPARSGYNVIQANIAIGSGQIFGKGVRQGTQSHLKFLPERHTDFAFASFAEEFGFMGVSILFVSYFFFLDWILKAGQTDDHFLYLLAQGAFWLFFSQIVINTGMNLGLLPVTGITLPFISYGGSSLISFFLVSGLVFVSLK